MPDADDEIFNQLKRELRARALERRAEAVDASASGAAAAHIFGRAGIGAGDIVAGYVAMRGEIDPAPLMTILAARGIALALPVVESRAAPLVFRAWSPGDPLVPGAFKTLVPTPKQRQVIPSIVIVPLLAFDRRGARLGYGGGFYDRTLGALRAQGTVHAIGLAYAFQEADTLPVTDNDQMLDAIATEREFIAVRERTA